MGIQENKALYARYIEEAFNRGNVAVLDELLSDDYTFHDAPPGTPPGREGVRRTVEMFRTAFPDLHIEIEEQVAEGDVVVSRSVTRGTHRGVLMGIAPTGRQMAMPGMVMARIRDGKLTDSWVQNNVLGLLGQLGVEVLPGATPGRSS